MTTITVTTQAELDAALTTYGTDENVDIIIDSPEGVWLKVFATGSASVTAKGSASVHVHGSARVAAFDSTSVHVTGSN